MSRSMEKKKVVTSFLTYGGKFLLLKRSERVASMRRRWHGVSGYLEEGEDPYERALKEIMEEVSLQADDVELVKKGGIIESWDASNDRVWQVHTFLFKIKDPGKIRLDWEHDDSRWVYLEELVNYDTVPNMREALMRLL